MTSVGRQATLVAHYGRKLHHVAALIDRLQGALEDSFGSAFCSYDLEQVHGTIVGLEGCRVNHRANTRVRGARSGSYLDLEGLFRFLGSPAFVPIHVRVGGFRADEIYPFRSRDAHPHQRSFSIQTDTAVAIGWPVEHDAFPDSLDRLRRSFQQFGIGHKWHRTVDEVDNDLFLVLGRLDARETMDAAVVDAAEASLRSNLAAGSGTTIEITRETLSVVVYEDAQLPLATSRRYALAEPDLAMKLAEIYPLCTAAKESRT